jgi:hypothetical protein
MAQSEHDSTNGLNTHDFEVISRGAIDAMAAIVADFLLQPDEDSGA